MITNSQPLDIHTQDLYSSNSLKFDMDSQANLFRYLNQSEHSSITDSSVNPLVDEAKKIRNKSFHNSPKYKLKQRIAKLGVKNPNWKGGISKNYININPKTGKPRMKQMEYLYSKENIEKLRFNRKNQIISPSKGKKLWADKKHPKGMLGKKHTEKSKLKMGRSGKSNPMYGVRLEQNVHRMRINNPMFNPKIAEIARAKIHQKQREKFKDNSYKEKWLKIIRGGIVKPTKLERIIINLVRENNIPFSYVGNGKFWLKGDNTIFNPDFISQKLKCIIEVYGEYWHNLPNRIKNDKYRLETYKKFGYKTLIIWDYELKNINSILNKIKIFIGGNLNDKTSQM